MTTRSRHRRLRSLWMVLALGVAATPLMMGGECIGPLPSPAPSATPAPTPSTCVLTGECPTDEICVQGQCVAAAGTITQLTTSPSDDVNPAWDPASETIAFRTDRSPALSDSIRNIGGVQADGTGEDNLAVGPNSGFGIGLSLSWVGDTGLLMTNERVTFHEYMTFDTSQAPFTRTVFDDDDAAFTQELSITDGGGGDFIDVSRDGGTVIWRFRPSKAGTTDSLRFASYSSLTGQNADAVGTVLMTNDAFGTLGSAALTPDGSQMVISLESISGTASGFDLFLYTVADPPVLVRRLTTSGASEGDTNANPDVSPDGTFIAFDRTPLAGNADLYGIGIDGTGLAQWTSGEQNESHPSWSPDGDRIAFQQFDDDNWNIYLLTLAD